jgi:hypothetical protein
MAIKKVVRRTHHLLDDLPLQQVFFPDDFSFGSSTSSCSVFHAPLSIEY